MTTTSSPSHVDTPSPRRRRRSLPSISLLATGESMIWLMGGALAFCLTMIGGLLALVFYQGSRTLWPLPVVQVELDDGSSQMGEIVREEDYWLSADRISDDEAAAAALKREMGDIRQKRMHRQLFRTGNFELTQTHFRWISEYDIQHQSRPEWALVLERVEWGRFYGVPQKVVESRVRSPSSDEVEVTRLLQVLETYGPQLDGDDQQAIHSAQESLRAELAKVRQRNVREFLDETRQEPADQIEFQGEDGMTLSETDATPDSPIQVARRIWQSPEMSWRRFQEIHGSVIDRVRARYDLAKHDLGEVDRTRDAGRLAVRTVELRLGIALENRALEWAFAQDEIQANEQQMASQHRALESLRHRYAGNSQLMAASDRLEGLLRNEHAEQTSALRQRIEELQSEVAQFPDEAERVVRDFLSVHSEANRLSDDIQLRMRRLDDENNQFQLIMKVADGQDVPVKVMDIVRAYAPNQLTLVDKWGVYLSRWREFVSAEPREANNEGGVFPAIWGTVAMTLIMSVAVVPFGVLAALYLREYARTGPVVSAIRIAMNNLAGVPSIVFGVFGLGFFCYMIGAYIDGGPRNMGISVWPAQRWFVTVGILAIVAVSAFVIGMVSLATPSSEHPLRKQLLQWTSGILWIGASVLFLLVVFVSPHFHGFFEAKLPNPTFGKGGLIWSALTLALMTLPVVIVATEESLSAVPNSMREGSYACGAGKWQTIRRIVLPQAMPGIMTGMILAMARGAGEVAPLMLVGAVKSARELAVDDVFPFVHPDRSFMHLGFHIYDLGFQSQNSEAAKPMVFTTTLLLIVLIAVLNISAVWLRGRLRRRFRTGQF